MLNLFYEEPDGDRWLPLDRYPRRVARRLLRGAPQPGGQKRIFLNLCAGLDRLGARYRVNDYGYAKKNPAIWRASLASRLCWMSQSGEIRSCLELRSIPTPDDPHLLQRLPIKKVLVPRAG